jgi:DNA polymerase-3 subunit delta'
MPFRDVVGHRRLVGLLARSVRHDTLPPSLILSGPSGIGKRMVALATAQALNCLDASARESGDACGRCAACVRIARGVHPDVPIVAPGDSGSIKVDEIREVVDRAAYRPFEGRRRVVIVDDADALVPAAQNALLKTLEEPPSASVFLLVTSRPDVLLPTVRSRCPRLRFQALAPEDVASALVRLGRSDDEARAAAATSGGSVQRALDLGDEMGALAEARDAALRVLVQAARTEDPRRRLEGARELVAAGGAGGAADREQLGAHLQAMSALLRDAALAAAGADQGGLAHPGVPRGGLSAFEGERAVRAFAAVDRALEALQRNASAKLVADWLVLQL